MHRGRRTGWVGGGVFVSGPSTPAPVALAGPSGFRIFGLPNTRPISSPACLPGSLRHASPALPLAPPRDAAPPAPPHGPLLQRRRPAGRRIPVHPPFHRGGRAAPRLALPRGDPGDAEIVDRQGLRDQGPRPDDLLRPPDGDDARPGSGGRQAGPVVDVFGGHAGRVRQHRPAPPVAGRDRPRAERAQFRPQQLQRHDPQLGNRRRRDRRRSLRRPRRGPQLRILRPRLPRGVDAQRRRQRRGDRGAAVGQLARGRQGRHVQRQHPPRPPARAADPRHPHPQGPLRLALQARPLDPRPARGLQVGPDVPRAPAGTGAGIGRPRAAAPVHQREPDGGELRVRVGGRAGRGAGGQPRGGGGGQGVGGGGGGGAGGEAGAAGEDQQDVEGRPVD